MTSSPGYVARIRTENIWSRARQAIMPFVERLVSKPETSGVVALSGLADRLERRFLDVHSDLDLALFISVPQARGFRCAREFSTAHPERLPLWLPAFSFMIPLDGKRMEVNCRQLIIEVEEHPDLVWPSPKQEAFQETSEVLYDRQGRVAALLRAKCCPPCGDRLAVLASQLPWYGWRNPTSQLHRGLVLNAKVLLNHAVEILVELLYLAMDHHPPALKWRTEALLDAPGLPCNFEERIRRVLEAHCSPESISEAIGVLRGMSMQVLKHLTADGRIPPDPYRYVAMQVDDDKQLCRTTGADDLVARTGQGCSEAERERLFDLANFCLLSPGEDLPRDVLLDPQIHAEGP